MEKQSKIAENRLFTDLDSSEQETASGGGFGGFGGFGFPGFGFGGFPVFGGRFKSEIKIG